MVAGPGNEFSNSGSQVGYPGLDFHYNGGNPHIEHWQKEIVMKIHPDLKPGSKFPDFQLPDHDGNVLKLTQHMRGWPTILVFYRGIW